MDKWIVRPGDSSGRGSKKRLLLLSGSRDDARAIIKEFGKLCGRPALLRDPEGYNWRIPLHDPDEKTLERLEKFLGSRAPSPLLKATAVDPPVDGGAGSFAAWTAPPREPASEEVGPQKPVEKKQDEPSRAEPPAPFSPPVVVASFESVSSAPLVDLGDPREALDPQRTFQSLSIGPYNRFAHASAVSVANEPGAMYNPFLLYGPPESGKSLMIQAMANKAVELAGPKSVMLTSGWRLSVFFRSPNVKGDSSRAGAFFAAPRVLIIDDLHLLAMDDSTRLFLSNLFEAFLAGGKQLIASSVYPPPALESLAAKLKTSFLGGRASAMEMRLPPSSVWTEPLKEFIQKKNMQISDDEMSVLSGKIESRALEGSVWVERLKRLIELGASLGQIPRIADLTAALFDMGPAEGGRELPRRLDLRKAHDFAFPKSGAGEIPLVWFCPQGTERLLPEAQGHFFGTLRDLGISRAYRILPSQFYDPARPLGLPFEIGEICRRIRPRAVVLLGPPPSTPLAKREAEWVHATSHVLRAMRASAAYLPYQGVKVYGSFLRAHLDLLG